MKSRTRGLATVWAIALLVFMSGALITMSGVFAAQLRRTQAAAAGAQIRQILAAAAPYATEELTARGAEPRIVKVPVPVDSAALTLTLAAATDGDVQVQVAAVYKEKKGAEVLTFIHGDAGGWTIKNARLTLSP